MYDLIIRNGAVIPGWRTEMSQADIGISEGIIVSLADRLPNDAGRRIIEADGLCVCPGFIDMHSHSDLAALRRSEGGDKIRQGVTTEVVGNCGFSLFPVSTEHREEARGFLGLLLNDVEERDLFPDADGYLSRIERPVTNIVSLVGHNMLRICVNGQRGEISAAALRQCRDLLARQLKSGARGLSTGLLYSPACFCETPELVALAEVVKAREGLFSCHIRDEGDNLQRSIEEVIHVAKATGASVEISHLKVSGRMNWGAMPSVLKRIEGAREDGCDLNFDCYPYTFGNTTITALLPPEVLDGDMDQVARNLRDGPLRTRAREAMSSGRGCLNSIGPENIILSGAGASAEFPCAGKSLLEAARLAGKDLADFIFDLVIAERGRCGIFLHQMCEEDVRAALAHPLGCLGTDGIPVLGGMAHPRLKATFPRMLAEYVRDRKICPLPEAIRKMTFLPAQKLRLEKRGAIRPGYIADLVLFDLARLDAQSPARNGIEHVLIAGEVAVEQGQYTGARAGRALRRRKSVWHRRPRL